MTASSLLPIIDFAELDADARRRSLARPQASAANEIHALARKTIDDVRARGDDALLHYAEQFDGGAPAALRVSPDEIDAAMRALEPQSLAALQRAIDNSTFDELKKQESKSGFGERSDNAESFFRKGQGGSWREALTPEQVDRVIESNKEQMQRLGYWPLPAEQARAS